jgi:hypothetical protein
LRERQGLPTEELLGSEVAALLRRIVHPRSHQGFSNLEGRRGRALYRRESRSYPYDASMRNLGVDGRL